MKSTDVLVARAALALLCLGLAGCASHKLSINPIGNGFEEITHGGRSNIAESGQARISFDYQAKPDPDPDAKPQLIWPSLYGVNEVIHDQEAVFVGDVATFGSQGPLPRLFVVKPPELPVDITSIALWRWSKVTGNDFTKALANYSLVTPVDNNGRLELQLDFWADEGSHWPDKSVLDLDWNQVSELVQAVKSRGLLKKDPHWHTPYIGD